MSDNPKFIFGNHEYKDPEIPKELEYNYYSKVQWDEWLSENMIENKLNANSGCLIKDFNHEYIKIKKQK
jgi:hypothetical protein